MANAQQDVPKFEGLTFIQTQPVIWSDARTGQVVVFPVHHYSDDKTGELVLVAEDRFERILDGMLAHGVYGRAGGAA